MTKYREILRLSSLGFSNRNIALSGPCSRNTVAKVLKRAQELDISWPLEDNQTDEVLEGLFYPKQRDRSQKRMPDCDYIHKELLRLDNSSTSEWTNLFENTAMVAALVDRLTFRSYVLDMNGDSYRLDHSKNSA